MNFWTVIGLVAGGIIGYFFGWQGILSYAVGAIITLGMLLDQEYR